MKKTVFVLTILLLSSLVFAQTTLSDGDITMVTINADADVEDHKIFDFVPLVDLDIGTIIYFTDDAWISGATNNWRGSEGIITYTAPNNITAGNPVTYLGYNADGFIETESGFDPSGSGDNIIVYQGSTESPVFLYGIGWAKSNNWIYNISYVTNTSDIPPGLSTENNTIFQPGSSDNYQYNGSTSFISPSACLSAVGDESNWSGGDVPYSAFGTDFTLPVTLSSFTAQYINDTPILCWTTQSETNNAGWNIYRGETNDALANEETYQLNLSLGLIPGAGTTSEPTDYSFEDVFPVFQETTYFYWLESVDYSGETESFGPISLTIPENEWENTNSPEIPKNYGLHQNYPNPFNPSTEISFMLNENCIAELTVYNIKGEKVSTLFQNKSISKDELIRTNWDGKDNFGKTVSSGIYLYKLRTNKEDFVRKMILMK